MPVDMVIVTTPCSDDTDTDVTFSTLGPRKPSWAIPLDTLLVCLNTIVYEGVVYVKNTTVQIVMRL